MFAKARDNLSKIECITKRKIKGVKASQSRFIGLAQKVHWN